MHRILFLAFFFTALIGHAADFPVPEGYELQMLEPLGGKVAKPQGWHYRGGMTPVGFDWTIAKESTDEYETGLRIQGFMGVKEGTGKTPREFAINGLKEKATGAKVFRRWPETQVGCFFRSGVEIEEVQVRDGKEVRYHVIYSALWNEAWGMVLFTIFGAPESDWKKAEPISEVMSGIEVIAPSRFEKKTEGEAAATGIDGKEPLPAAAPEARRP